MKLLTVVLLLTVMLTGFTQITFERRYGTSRDEKANNVQPISTGGYLLAGSASDGGTNPDVFLVRTDEWGDTLWTRTYPRTWSSRAQAALEIADGFIIAGFAVTSTGPSRTDILLMKINDQGDTLWTKTYGTSNNEQAFDIKITNDGGYIVCGQSDEPNGRMNYYLVKTNSMGDSIWTRKHGLPNQEKAYAKAVHQTTEGGYLIAGYVDDYTIGTGNGFIYLVITDSLGLLDTTRVYNFPTKEQIYDAQGISDGYVIAGHIENIGAGGWDMFLMKTDELGDSLWTCTYGDSMEERGYGVEQTLDGGFILAGMTRSLGAGSSDYYLIRTDNNGDTLWTRTFGGNSHEEAFDVHQTVDGGYAVAGYSYSYTAGWADFFLVKTDGNGYVPIQAHNDQPIQNYELFQNYPNPFNASTVISWQFAVSSRIKLSISDISGKAVAVLLNEKQPAGFHSIEFDASNLASGIYVYRLSVEPLTGKAGRFIETRKMVLIR
jgi:hypothetical protein